MRIRATFVVVVLAMLAILCAPVCAQNPKTPVTISMVDHWTNLEAALAAPPDAPFYYPVLLHPRQLEKGQVVQGLPQTCYLEMDLPDRMGGRGFVKIEAGRKITYSEVTGEPLYLTECGNLIYGGIPIPPQKGEKGDPGQKGDPGGQGPPGPPGQNAAPADYNGYGGGYYPAYYPFALSFAWDWGIGWGTCFGYGYHHGGGHDRGVVVVNNYSYSTTRTVRRVAQRGVPPGGTTGSEGGGIIPGGNTGGTGAGGNTGTATSMRGTVISRQNTASRQVAMPRATATTQQRVVVAPRAATAVAQAQSQRVTQRAPQQRVAARSSSSGGHRR